MNPREKKKKELKESNLLNNIKKGTSLSSIGGIQGTFVSANEDSIVLMIDRRGSQVTIKKKAIDLNEYINRNKPSSNK